MRSVSCEFMKIDRRFLWGFAFKAKKEAVILGGLYIYENRI